MMQITPMFTMAKPVAFDAKIGRIRTPTTFFSVRPGPGNWVCFWYQTRPRCTAMSANSSPGRMKTWRM